jgi:hypothetical protein
MRKFLIFLTALTLCSAVNASAQEDAQTTSRFKRFENNFYIGAGRFIDHYNSPRSQTNFYTDKGFSLKLGYGLNYYFTEMFSLMAGVSYREEDTYPFKDDLEGDDTDYFSFWDVPVVFQVHLKDPLPTKNKWMVGLGLVYSHCKHNDTYYIDADPRDPLGGKTKIKDNYVSLMPCAAYEIKHFRFGVESYIGLQDVNRKHDGLVTGKKYLHNICGVVAFKF